MQISLRLGLIFCIVMFVLGCSGGSITPDLDETGISGLTNHRQNQSGTSLWGYYDLLIEPETGNISVIPNRQVGFAINVVKFLNNDPLGIGVSFNGTETGPGYIDVDMDITIKHPLPLEKFNGYDVRGIFVGSGSSSMIHNPDLIYPKNGSEQVLLNADGNTRWYNASEFLVQSIFGYVPGKLSSPGYSPSATLNGYKYFGEGLASDEDLFEYLSDGGDNVGCFIAGTENSRNYVVRFPIPIPGIKYGYAVVANWDGPEPDDHPAHAADAVGFDLEYFGNVFYVNPSDNGGDLKLYLSVFDWFSDAPDTGPMEDYNIILESTVLSAPHELTASEMTPVGGNLHYSTYQVDIPADNVTTEANNVVWMIVEYPDLDYTNPLGAPNAAGDDPIQACARLSLPVINGPLEDITVISPNGGENWDVGSDQYITWASGDFPGTVFIEYSQDDFWSDVNTIATAEENDGIYLWEDIPNIVNDETKVRVSSTSDPGIYDESDETFSITAWIEILSPNGGEEWDQHTDIMIYWDAWEYEGGVQVLYSTDDFVDDVQIVKDSWPNNGQCIWDYPPRPVSDTLKISITTMEAPIVSDVSDSFFAIKATDPFIEVTSPNGGEDWWYDEVEEITWDYWGFPGDVNLEYSKDDFIEDVHIIEEGVQNLGHRDWDPIPIDPSENVRVRIRSINDPGIFDSSDEPFTISESPCWDFYYIEDEPNNGWDYWTFISYGYTPPYGGGTPLGKICPAFDSDYFLGNDWVRNLTVMIAAPDLMELGGGAQIGLSDKSSGGNGIDSNVITSTDFVGNLNSYSNAPVILTVSNATENMEYYYAAVVWSTDSPNEEEPNDNWEDAQELSLPDFVSGEGTWNNNDWYTFTTTERGLPIVNCIAYYAVDYVAFQLYDDSITMIDSRGGSSDPSISLHPDGYVDPATFYIQAQSDSGDEYNLQLLFLTEPD